MSRLEIHQFPFVFDKNYGVLIHCSETGQTASIDAGVAETHQAALDEKGWDLTHILVTHHHRDHVSGVVELKENNGCAVIGPDYVARTRIAAIDQRVKDGDTFHFGGHLVRVIHAPGHTEELVMYYFESQGIIFVGDALFGMGCANGFETTAQVFQQSLQKIAALPAETIVYCGHEYTQENGQFAIQVDPTNEALRSRIEEIAPLRAADMPTVPFALAAELATNPFLRLHNKEIRKNLGMEDATDAEVFNELLRLRSVWSESLE